MHCPFCGLDSDLCTCERNIDPYVPCSMASRPDDVTFERDRLTQAVRFFSAAMRSKLHQKAEEGCRGWDNPEFTHIIRAKLRDCAARLCEGDTAQAVDVANLAMMLAVDSYRNKL